MKNKILGLALMCLVSQPLFAAPFAQPIIQGKTYNNWKVPLRLLGKPKSVIKGKVDECNGGYFPDEYDYGSFKLLDTGIIKEVYFSHNNELLFHGQKLRGGIDQKQFMQQFKKYELWEDSENKNIVYSGLAESGNDSIEFVFKNGKLLKYKLFFDDC
ncbi:hypothetical protein F892_01106 [Acinetobacter vivianii]|uniref:DUF306 domain-containing protein n=1 Tax=Acinetobacter vivianii TaxID=1776742 RepID=N9NLK3_9GAMM|nr:hypothetical protein [Acinetobacter vivianii]ENX21868.1 hypothetical protein F892_01106 [Acinetobacter vivianii]GGI60788.1 hypothetical protein GCM10011446_22830 [Acinetobacter vivianii]